VVKRCVTKLKGGIDTAVKLKVVIIGGHRHRPQYRRYPTSDINICYSDIGRKYVGLKTVIPISEGFRYRHLSPKNIWSHQQDLNPRQLFSQPLCWFMNFWMSDIGYRIKVCSDIRYNVGLRSLQSNIGSSDIKLSPISLITDIGVSAHLWLSLTPHIQTERSQWHVRGKAPSAANMISLTITGKRFTYCSVFLHGPIYSWCSWDEGQKIGMSERISVDVIGSGGNIVGRRDKGVKIERKWWKRKDKG
jgi:hypothetical protein